MWSRRWFTGRTGVLGSAALVMFLQAMSAPTVAVHLEEARLVLADASTSAASWAGPTIGPPARPRRTIAVLAEDLRNSGVLGVAQGIREAAREIGWQVRVLDAGGTPEGRRRALADALAGRLDGLVLCGSDANELEPALRAAGRRLPPVVGWHAAAQAGAVPQSSMAMNVTTDPLVVARLAALAVIAQSEGRAGVVVFNDSRFAIATAKAQAMAEAIRACEGCSVLEVVDVPISESASRTAAVVRALLDRHGGRWTHTLAINDIYFDHAVPVFISRGVPGSRMSLVSAGDGSPAAFMRIRAGSYQTATVAEPLIMQGWQIVDELNRRMAGEPVSGFVAGAQLVTSSNVGSNGPTRYVHDPSNGYRDIYRQIWGLP